MRRPRMTVPMLIALCAGWAAAAAAEVDSRDLARVARAERERRARLGRAAPVVGNEALKGLGAGERLSTVSGASREELEDQLAAIRKRKEASAPAAAGAAGSTEPKKDEAYWRERLAEARRRIGRLEDDLDWARRRVTMLQMGLVVPTDAMREFNRKVEHDQVLAEKSTLEHDLAEARQEPERIREEARHEGVPPGWLR